MKSIKKVSEIIVVAMFVLLLASPAVFAQGTIPDDILPGGEGMSGETTVGGWVDLLITVVRWFYTIVFIIAVLFILLSAFNFITSKGDATKTKTARTQLMYAVIGIAVALISYGIIYFVRDTLDSGV